MTEVTGKSVQEKISPKDKLDQAIASGVVTEPQNKGDPYYCNPCDKILKTKQTMKDHIDRSTHKHKLSEKSGGKSLNADQKEKNEKGPDQKPEIHHDDDETDLVKKAFQDGKLSRGSSDDSYAFYCHVCQQELKIESRLGSHLSSKKHQSKVPKKTFSERDGKAINHPVKVGAACSGLSVPPSANGEKPSGVKDECSSNNPRKGHVYVFNVLHERDGAEIDSSRINDTFTKKGYVVIHHKNFTKKGMTQEIDRICKDKTLAGVGALIVFIMSHGTETDVFHSKDGEDMSLKCIVNSLASKENIYIKDKPKIIFTQYCQGDALESDHWGSGTYKFSNAIRNVAVIHAVNKGIRPMRSPEDGSIFVKALCSVLNDPNEPRSLCRVFMRLGEKMRVMWGTTPVMINHLCDLSL